MPEPKSRTSKWTADWTALLQQIKNNDPNLTTSLNISYNQIGATEVKGLIQALQVNRTLTELDLHENQIGAAGAKDLIMALKDNRTLTRLDLRNNEIGPAGAKDLSQALQANCTLTHLGLGGNQIGEAGAKDLIQALKDNRTLTGLGLSNNEIGDAGAKDLSEALTVNRTLTYLDLGGNQIGEAGAKDLIQALKDNRTLTGLGLNGFNIGYHARIGLEELIQRNTVLRDECHQAAKSNDMDKMMALLDQGVSVVSTIGKMTVFKGVSAIEYDGNTLLHKVVQSKHVELVKRLIERLQAQGIPLDVKNDKGQTAQDLAQATPALLALFEAPSSKPTTNQPTKLLSSNSISPSMKVSTITTTTTECAQQTVSVTARFQQLLQNSFNEPLPDQGKRIVFQDTDSAKSFVEELFKIGFENRGMKGARRKMQVLKADLEHSQERYAIDLTADEWDALNSSDLQQQQPMTQLNKHSQKEDTQKRKALDFNEEREEEVSDSNNKKPLTGNSEHEQKKSSNKLALLKNKFNAFYEIIQKTNLDSEKNELFQLVQELRKEVEELNDKQNKTKIGNDGEQYVFKTLLPKLYKKRFLEVPEIKEGALEFEVEKPNENNKNHKATNPGLKGKKVEWIKGTHDIKVTTFFKDGSKSVKTKEVKTTEKMGEFEFGITQNQLYELKLNLNKTDYYFFIKNSVDKTCIKLKAPKLVIPDEAKDSGQKFFLAAKKSKIIAMNPNNELNEKDYKSNITIPLISSTFKFTP